MTFAPVTAAGGVAKRFEMSVAISGGNASLRFEDLDSTFGKGGCRVPSGWGFFADDLSRLDTGNGSSVGGGFWLTDGEAPDGFSFGAGALEGLVPKPGANRSGAAAVWLGRVGALADFCFWIRRVSISTVGTSGSVGAAGSWTGC